MNYDSVSSIVQIVLINAVLSGDNAVVIALASHGLPPARRRQAMFYGTALAVFLRLVLTFVVSYLLLLPGLGFLGGVLLVYIACKLMQQEVDPAGQASGPSSSLRTAIFRIAFADLVMSLDNVVAIAGVSRSDPIRLAVGLVLSITMILTLSSLIVTVMNRFRWVVYAGTATLVLAAAGMMEHDFQALSPVNSMPSQHAGLSDLAGWPFRLAFLSICLTSGHWWPGRALTDYTRPESGPDG
jgi:YjbE family integral membrane protein